jgi:uncharacterized protein
MGLQAAQEFRPVITKDGAAATRKIAGRPAATLFVGPVMHARLKPLAHRFSYRVFNVLLDIDRLEEVDAMSRVFSVNRANVLSFHEADHVDGQWPSLRAYADHMLQAAGLRRPAARILIACYPRVLGRVFNPISVYYAFDEHETPVAMIYEVRNTFGERHTYVCPIRDGELSPAGVRQERDKLFYVSPFMEMAMRYYFRMNVPLETMRWRILETDTNGPVLSATYSGTARAFTGRNLVDCLLRIPLQTWKIVGGIHLEALRLWLKGARCVPRGSPPAPFSVVDAGCPRDRALTDGDDAPQADRMKRSA